MKAYEIYLNTTGEVLAYGSNDFTAMNNLVSLRKKYGESIVNIRWIKLKQHLSACAPMKPFDFELMGVKKGEQNGKTTN